MQSAEYKLERFSNPQFPIYLSTQSGRKTLVKIHYHTSAEIMQVMEGQVQLFAGGTHRQCQKGEVIFLPPGVVHEVTSLTEDAAIRGVVYECSLTDLAHRQLDFSDLLSASRHVPYVVDAQLPGYEPLCGCIDRIHVFYGNESLAGRLQIVSCLLQIEAELIRMFALEENMMNRHYQKLQPVLIYMKEHYAEKIRTSHLSRLIHVCDDRLIRLFKEVTGETPVSYLTNLRLEASLRLLTDTDESIADIAEKTGFGSDTYMGRVFKQKLNATPGRYRRRAT